MLINICNTMERQGKFNERPPKYMKGADAIHKFMQNQINEEELIL